MSMPKWIKNAIVYEIYPQSFCDSNGDGIGDLQGIISKLDYIQSLNVTAVWLNPCFDSPFRDAGYDVSDYRKIAPRYGTNEDMKQLIEECHKRGMKLLLDLVPGHTSTEHKWFLESQKDSTNPYANYYIWSTSIWDSPKNYRFISGTASRSACYMTNFFAFQPKLNYGFCPPDPKYPWQLPMDHPDVLKVREELREVMKFWLDMGCDGFRVDMAGSLVYGADKERGNRELWNDYRAWLDKNYPEAVLISEWGMPPEAIAAGFHVDFMLHFGQAGYAKLLRSKPSKDSPMAYAFFDASGKGDSTPFLNDLTGNLESIGTKGFCGLISGNHDMSRICAGRSVAELKTIFTFLYLLPGVPFLYYGDEIGMKDMAWLPNKEGSYGRASARTPMQWAPGAKAGFSTADESKFYLPLDPAADRPDVRSQENDKASLLNYVRSLFKLRRENPVLANEGDFKLLHAAKMDPVVVYERSNGTIRYIIAVNGSAKEVQADFACRDSQKACKVFSSEGTSLETQNGCTTIHLPASGFGIYKI